jgi:hypothetical protein
MLPPKQAGRILLQSARFSKLRSSSPVGVARAKVTKKVTSEMAEKCIFDKVVREA